MTDFHFSPLGTFIHPWFNKADTKFNADGLYHTDLDASGPEAEAVAARIEAASLAYLSEYTQEMTPKDAKKWEVLLPFERLEDDNGEPTGVIRFTFKQNAKIRVKDKKTGEMVTKDISIELRDSKNEIINVQVWSGSEGRTLFSMRGIAVASSKKAGVRLDLAKAQITKLAASTGGGSKGFGVVEDGYVGDEAGDFGSKPQGDDQVEDQGGDY